MEGALMGVEADPDIAPPGVVRAALRDTWTSLRSVFGNPALRRIELALATSMVGDWAYATAVVVWAYGVGGARLVGIWMAVRYVLMAIVSPIGASLADRLPRKAVLIGSDLIRAVLAVVAGFALFVDAPDAVILVVATVMSLIGCIFRPAQMAWMPSLTRRPEELTAANGTSSTIESLAFFLGPALGALLVTTTSVQVVFLLNAATFLVSAVLVWGIRPIAEPTPGDDDLGALGGAGAAGPQEQEGMLAEMASGFRHIARDRDLVMVAILVCAQTVVAGATAVFGVVLAVDILHTG